MAGRRRRRGRAVGTTEYHLRRMFSALAGMPLSEYVRPAFRPVGHAARVPLIHQGINPHITALPQEEHLRLKAVGDIEIGR